MTPPFDNLQRGKGEWSRTTRCWRRTKIGPKNQGFNIKYKYTFDQCFKNPIFTLHNMYDYIYQKRVFNFLENWKLWTLRPTLIPGVGLDAVSIYPSQHWAGCVYSIINKMWKPHNHPEGDSWCSDWLSGHDLQAK